MKHFRILILSLLFFFCFYAGSASGADLRDTLEPLVLEQLGGLDTTAWDAYIRALDEDQAALLGGASGREFILQLLTGRFQWSAKEMLQTILRLFFQEFMLNLGLMGNIMVIAVLCGILRHMKDTFHNPSVGEISYFVCYMVVVILILQSLFSILQIGRSGIEQMVGFMQILFPILTALLIAMGGMASSAVMQPGIALLMGVVGTFLKNTMLPMILLLAILTMVSYIGTKVQITRLSKLINNLCVWTLGGVFTIFIGVLTIQGVMAASFDGISIRTAKFAIDTFVPIVGGMFSQTLDTIIGCSLLLKNAVGAAGLFIIAMICLLPALRILVLLLLYKLAGALLEPITDPRISDCLNSIGNILTLLLVTVMSIAVMFFMTVTLLIAAGNLSFLLR